jgi:hypothetical protein
MKSTEGDEGGNAMKAMFISFAVGLVVGVAMDYFA